MFVSLREQNVPVVLKGFLVFSSKKLAYLQKTLHTCKNFTYAPKNLVHVCKENAKTLHTYVKKKTLESSFPGATAAAMMPAA